MGIKRDYQIASGVKIVRVTGVVVLRDHSVLLKFPIFMKPKISFSCPQKHTFCSYLSQMTLIQILTPDLS